MPTRLEATVALVTGASSGIGAATARALAAEGATEALVARRRDRPVQVAETIGDHSGSALVLEADLTDPGQASDDVPVANLLFILRIMSSLAAIVGWLLAGREPATMARHAIE
jgi:NADP-dependent 3-hydroxy acid dehydrogenase YdfG